jgi:alpha-D-xyloside xylohydrolase
LQRWCANSLRVRLYDAALGAPPGAGPLQALVDPPTCDAAPLGAGTVGAGGLTNGNLAATAAADGTVSFVRVSDGVAVLAMAAPPTLTPLGRRDTLGNALYSGSVAFLRPGGGALPVPEEIYGLGEHKTGRLSYGRGFSWQFEESQRRATFADNSDISLPLFTSSVGYTLVWNLPSYGGITINATHIAFSSNATPALDFWLSVPPADVPVGTPPYASLSSQLVAAIGRPSDLPEWATGFWQCKLRYRSQAELLEAARGYAARGLPLSAIVIDFLHWPTFGEWRFIPSCWPDPTAMTAELAAQGVAVVVSVWPQVDPQSSRLPAMLASNLLIRNASGLPWFDRATFTRPGYLVDATNPEARAYQWGAVEEGYFNHGIAAYWLDAAEPQGAVPGSMTFWAGEDLQVGMAYPRENARTFFEGLASRGVRNGLTLSRSAWIGSQSVGGAVWSGDIFSNWTSFEQQIYIAQNMALSGNYLWTTDIGAREAARPGLAPIRCLAVCQCSLPARRAPPT